MPARTAAPCIRCRETLEINEAGIALSMGLKSVGLEGERLRGTHDQCYVCSACSVIIAFGEEPPKAQPLNVMAFHLIRTMVASDPRLAGKAWEELRERLGARELAEGEVLPPARMLRAG